MEICTLHTRLINFSTVQSKQNDFTCSNIIIIIIIKNVDVQIVLI